MQLAMNLELLELPKKVKQGSFIVLTDRDFEIIKFILEMKFSNVNDIYLRFFKINSVGLQCLTLRSAYRRLHLLEENNYLASTKNHKSGEKLYFATPKAYYLILNSKIEDGFISYPIKKIDYRTIDHDHKLIELRNDLETKEKVNSWKSDRYLKSKKEFNELSSLNIVPDAIYTNMDNENIAFELELTLKSKERYRAKIKSIVEYLRKPEVHPRAFRKVRFLCAKSSIYENLIKESKLYSKYFQVELMEQTNEYR